MTKRDIQYATPVTSYIQIWLKNLVTVFGNAMQQMYEENLHTKNRSLETWKSPISRFFFLFLEHKRMLTLEINKIEVERARVMLKK